MTLLWTNATSLSWTPPWWCLQGTCGSCSSTSRWGTRCIHWWCHWWKPLWKHCKRGTAVWDSEGQHVPIFLSAVFLPLSDSFASLCHREGRTFLRPTSSRRRWWWQGGWGTWERWAPSSTGSATAKKPTASDAATSADVSTHPLPFQAVVVATSKEISAKDHIVSTNSLVFPFPLKTKQTKTTFHYLFFYWYWHTYIYNASYAIM